MIIDRTHRSWILATSGLFVVSAVLYWVYVRAVPNGPTGGSWQGLSFGIAGSALMIFAGLLSARKKAPRQRLGTAKTWLRGHIWLGLLSVPLIFFHSGMRFGGPLEIALMIVFLTVIVSGVLGVLLQMYVPRLMKTAVPAEAIYEQIPEACEALRQTADRQIIADCGGLALADDEKTHLEFDAKREFRLFYVHSVRPYLNRTPGTKPAVSEQAEARMASASHCDGMFAQLREALPANLRLSLDRLKQIVAERRALEAQLRMHHWLHGWLFLHVPLSLALLVLGVVHAVMSVYY